MNTTHTHAHTHTHTHTHARAQRKRTHMTQVKDASTGRFTSKVVRKAPRVCSANTAMAEKRRKMEEERRAKREEKKKEEREKTTQRWVAARSKHNLRKLNFK